MRKILGVVFACLALTLGVVRARAQDSVAASEAYQVGLTFAAKDYNIQLPTRWMFTDRTAEDYFKAKSLSGVGTVALTSLKTGDPDAAEREMKSRIEKRGVLSDKTQKLTGTGGVRRSTSWFLKTKDGTFFVLLNFNNTTEKTDVLTIEWPVDAAMSPEIFDQQKRAQVELEMKVTIDAFYAKRPWDGSSLVYNSTLNANTSRITLKLPKDFAYSTDSDTAKSVHTWTNSKNSSQSYALVYGQRKENFEQFAKNFPDELQARYSGEEGSLGIGAITAYYNTVSGDKWEYIYVLTTQMKTNDGKPAVDKNGPILLHYFVYSQYRPAEDNVIFSLTYKELITNYSNPVDIKKLVDSKKKAVSANFESFKVDPISN